MKMNLTSIFFFFKKVAKDPVWPLNKYTILLQSVLKGKASKVYLDLKPEQTSDYKTVKETILKAYELVSEAYRQKCKNFEKAADKTHVEFTRDKERLFDRWCRSEKKWHKFQHFKRNDFTGRIQKLFHPSISNYTTEHKAQALQKASEMADEFFLAHKHIFLKSSHVSTFKRNLLLISIILQ